MNWDRTRESRTVGNIPYKGIILSAAMDTEDGEGRQTLGKAIAGTLSLLVLSTLGFAVVWLLWKGLSSIGSEVAAALITASATILVSVFVTVYNKRWDRNRQIKEKQREKKIPAYEDFSKFVFQILLATKMDEEISEEKMMESMMEFIHHIIIWGSDDFIQSFGEWKTEIQGSDDTQASPLGQLAFFEDLILAMRRDLGHEDEEFERGDLLRLFITDIDDYLPERR